MRPITSVQGWLARVRVSLQAVLGKLTGNPQAFDGQDLVDLAFAVAQQESDAPVQSLNDAVGASPSLPTRMSRQAGRGSVGVATAGSLGTAENPRPIPFNPEHIKVLMPSDGNWGELTFPAGEEHAAFGYFEDTEDGPSLLIDKVVRTSSGEYVRIDGHGLTEAVLRAIILSYAKVNGAFPVGLPGSLNFKNLKNFQAEFDNHRKHDPSGSVDDWAQAAIRNTSFGGARRNLGYGSFLIRLGAFGEAEGLKNIPKSVYVIARMN